MTGGARTVTIPMPAGTFRPTDGRSALMLRIRVLVGMTAVVAGVAWVTSVARGGDAVVRPLHLAQDFESVYDLEAPPPADAGVNEGGVNFDLNVRYLTDYVFRGIDRSESNGGFNDDKGRPIVF